MGKILTCVYCGMAYPEGTPPCGAQILTDHIKVCEKHPMREAENKIQKLRSALIGVVGSSDKKELQGMAKLIASSRLTIEEKKVNIDAIDTIIETEEI